MGSSPIRRATSYDVLLAQSVEHLTFNEGVVGSNPTQDTIFWVFLTLSSSGSGLYFLCVETEVQIL